MSHAHESGYEPDCEDCREENPVTVNDRPVPPPQDITWLAWANTLADYDKGLM